MSPIDIQDILSRAQNSARVGDHEAAERLLKNYLAKVPGSREARLLLGTVCAKQGKLSEAGDEFVKLLAGNPRDLEALNNAAVIYRRQGKYQDALEYLKEAIDIDPTRVEFQYNIGNIHKQMGNFKAASMAYSKVIELDPGYVPAYNNLGTIYDKMQEYDRAYGVFRKGLAVDPNNPTLHFNYGVALEANGRLGDAAEEYRAALRSKPGWLDPMNNLGIVLFKQGRHDKAMATFNRILKVDPFNAEARNNMGVVLADQGRAREAVKSYRQAIEADPRYTKAVVNLERALEASGDFSDALIELEKLVKLSPDSADIRNRLGSLYLKMERYPEALEQAEAALDWEPESIQALRTKGAVQRILGNDADAQTCFEKILSLDPGNYAFLLDLADIHFRRKEYAEAEDRIQSYLIRRPNDRNAKLLLGRLYAETGNRTHAIQVFEELARADPNDTEALAAAAELHKNAGSLEKAVRTADTLVNLQGKRATADDLSDLNKSLEFYESAVNAYSSSVKEMWNRNIKLMGAGEEEEEKKDDISLLMGAAGVSLDFDEESEALFTEGADFFDAEEDESDMILGDESFDIPEEDEPLYRDPLDALAEEPPQAPRPRAAPEAPLPDADKAPPAKTPNGEPLPEEPEQRTLPPTETPQQPAPPPAEYPPMPAAPPPKAPTLPETPQAEIPPAEEELDISPPEEDSGREEAEGAEAPGEDDAGELSAGDIPPEDGGEAGGEFPPLSPEEEIPLLEEEAPEDIFAEDPFAEDVPPEDVPAEEIPQESAGEFLPEETIPAEEETVPEETFAEEPVPEEAVPAGDELSAAETELLAADESPSVSTLVKLLNCLKNLTDNLPDKERVSFRAGKYPSILERVIDSLENLTIIRELPEETNQADSREDGEFDGSGS